MTKGSEMMTEPLVPDKSWMQSDGSMTNSDHTIDEGLEDQLRAAPNALVARHFAWEFCGDVWFDGELFVERVWRYHAVVGTYRAASLVELMGVVNAHHGAR